MQCTKAHQNKATNNKLKEREQANTHILYIYIYTYGHIRNTHTQRQENGKPSYPGQAVMGSQRSGLVASSGSCLMGRSAYQRLAAPRQQVPSKWHEQERCRPLAFACGPALVVMPALSSSSSAASWATTYKQSKAVDIAGKAQGPGRRGLRPAKIPAALLT